MMNIIDSHTHLHSIHEKNIDLALEIEKCKEAKMPYLLDIGIYPNDLQTRLNCYKQLLDMQNFNQENKDFRILLAAGIYPSAVIEATTPELMDLQIAVLKENILQCEFPIVAIGEIGVDLFHQYGTLENQKILFAKQIQLANELSLPILIHNREADQAILEVLYANPVDKGGLIHCFSSDLNFAQKAIELGFYISFAGNVTYKKSTTIAEAARLLPLDRILTETDSPYLAPQKLRGQLNTPYNTTYVAEFIAQLRDIPLSELANQVKTNFETLFQLI